MWGCEGVMDENVWCICMQCDDMYSMMCVGRFMCACVRMCGI